MQDQPTQHINTLAQYGVLGLFAIIMLYVIWYQEKQRTKREAEIKALIDVLSAKLDKYQQVDRERMEKVIVENTEVMQENIHVMQQVISKLTS
jgi:hypothetical protein